MTNRFAHFTTLFKHYLKRDWQKIMIWILGMSLFSGAYVPAFEKIAKGQGLIGMFETMKNPAMIAMVGPQPVKHVADYTLGALYANEMVLFCGLFAFIIAALHVISHTRKEEDLGLTELVRSFQVGRQANSLAVLCEVLLVNIILGLATAGIMVSFNAPSIDGAGALLFGSSVALGGFLGGSLALVCAQMMPTAAGSTSATLGLLGVLYILRASTDTTAIEWSRINPLSWLYLTRPFTANDWWPIIAGVVVTILLMMIAGLLEEGRDMGAGYLPERQGKAHAGFGLQSVTGLFWRLNRGTIISWLVAFVVMGAAYGSIYGEMQTFLKSNALMQQMFTQSGTSLEASFTSTIMTVIVGLVAILPIVIVNRLTAEETQSHLSQFLAAPISRLRLYMTTIGLAIVTGLVGLLLGSGGLGVTALAAMGNKASLHLSDFLAAGFGQLPMVFFMIGLAALALGWAPQLGKVVYGYLGYAFVLDYFSGLLTLPKWLKQTAIQTWLAKLPVDNFDGTAFTVIMILSCGLMVLGYVGYRKRDLREGA